jgi:hypothetical protein
MMSRAGRAIAGRTTGSVITVATIAVMVAAGTAAGIVISAGGGTSVASPAASAASLVVTRPASATDMASEALGASVLITDTCRYSHEANDDPILDPGKPGQSMAHDFFGNVTTSATSTASSLVGRATTCSTSQDASAYWTPVLYQDGVAVTPMYNLVYWAGLHAQRPAVVAPPAGLELIAGDENATSPQSTSVVAWRCADPERQIASPRPVNCAGTRGLELRVTFPSCWNGHTLNGASQTNVVYPEPDARCPAGYPVRIPTIIFHVVYPITSPANLTLSMGPGMQGSTDTAHGDFINGWNQSVLARVINGCAGKSHTCGHVTGSDARVHPRTVGSPV